MVLEIKDSQDEFPYEWVLTQDQSTTLKSISENSEWMHSLHGAYSESQYIYGDAIRMALSLKKEVPKFKVLSMGLGLGYLELITVFECIKANVYFDIESFELDDRLKDLFKFQCHLGFMVVDSIDSKVLQSSVAISKTTEILEFLKSFEIQFPNELKLCRFYNLSLEFYLDHLFSFFLKDYGFEVLKNGFDQILNLNINKLNSALENLTQKNPIQKNSTLLNRVENVEDFGNSIVQDLKSSINLNGPIDLNRLSRFENLDSQDNTLNPKKFNVIFYDAFSSNTQSELWSEDFLTQFILLFSNPEYCVFSTYAKVGKLNRSLKNNGFVFIPKRGFANKRESTLALKTK